MDIKDLKGHFDGAVTELKELHKRQSDEIAKHGETTAQTAKAVHAVEERITSMSEDVKGIDERTQELEKKMGRPGFGGGAQSVDVTPGMAFVMSDEFKHAQAKGARSTQAVELKSLLQVEKKDITSIAASAGDLVDAMRLPEIYRDPADRPRFIREIMNVGTTSSNAIEYMEENVFTNNAGPQFSSGASPSEFELVAKNKSDVTFDLQTAPVRTMAHYMVASRQILDDASMLRNYIDGRLTYGLMLNEDDNILNGDGTGGALSGILNNANIQDAGAPASGVSILDHIRDAIADARGSEYAANYIVLNPTDWATIQKQKGTDGHYIYATPQGGTGVSPIWGVPVFESTAITAGTFLLGNFQLGATLWDRQQASIRISESHEDLFVKNGVVILAEHRVALTVYRPQAFVKGTFS